MGNLFSTDLEKRQKYVSEISMNQWDFHSTTSQKLWEYQRENHRKKPRELESVDQFRT